MITPERLIAVTSTSWPPGTTSSANDNKPAARPGALRPNDSTANASAARQRRIRIIPRAIGTNSRPANSGTQYSPVGNEPVAKVLWQFLVAQRLTDPNALGLTSCVTRR